MGLLIECAEVNLEVASRRRAQTQSQSSNVMGAPGEIYYTEALHTIAINTRETEFGKLVEPIPITITAPKQYHAHGLNGFAYAPHHVITTLEAATRLSDHNRPAPSQSQHVVKENVKDSETSVRPPPKKKWIKEYLEEEPKSPVSVRLVPSCNGVVRLPSPVPVAAPAPAPAPVPAPALAPAVASAPAPVLDPALATAPLLDFTQEHSRVRTTSNSHGPPQIPSPPSVSSNGSASSGSGSGGGAPRAGTREVHNKLEKNRRAHLKECFELLKRQLPATPTDKKPSNLSILHSALRYIQVLRRKERECEHEMERLAREKIASQQRLAALKREVSVRVTGIAALQRSVDGSPDEKDKDDRINGVIGIPISITSPSPPITRMDSSSSSPPRTLNLSTKLRTLPIQITPTTSQVVRTTYGARHNTLTLTTLTPAETGAQNGQVMENGVGNTISTTLVHPAQIHLPISQVVSSGGLVVGSALQLLSAGGGLRVLHAPPVHANGITAGEANRIVTRENGLVTSPPITTESGTMVSGLTPLVVTQSAAHLLHTHTFTHNMVETQVVKGSVAPLTVSAQYLSAAAIVKPVVVVSGAHSPPPPS